ncbi:MAG: hypothetical protein HY556_03515 [Euryarchaeota archaeon]|nr:hypothetical protein [Euryarchaeota archaeon]
MEGSGGGRDVLGGNFAPLLLSVITVIATAAMAIYTAQLTDISRDLAHLEAERTTVDLQVLDVRIVSLDPPKLGAAVANKGLQDVSIQWTRFSFFLDPPPNVTVMTFPLHEAADGYTSRVVPGAQWIWVEQDVTVGNLNVLTNNTTRDKIIAISVEVAAVRGQPASLLLEGEDLALELSRAIRSA